MTELMRRRRALMAKKHEILFSWKPENGLSGIQITGSAPSSYQLTQNSLKLLGASGFKTTQIEIPNPQAAKSFSLHIIADFSSVYLNSENLFAIRFMGVNSRINYNPYNQEISITDATGYAISGLTGTHEIVCVYNGITKSATWKIDDVTIGVTQNASASTSKVAVYYAPYNYGVSNYLEVKEITFYKEEP